MPTGCDTAVVVNHEECADGVAQAFTLSVHTTLGGVFPDALLHDGKPCYDEASLVHLIQETGSMIKASPAQRQLHLCTGDNEEDLAESRAGGHSRISGRGRSASIPQILR